MDNFITKRVLAIETITATPHSETTVELINTYSASGHKTFYCPLFASLQQRYYFTPPGGLRQRTTKVSWLDYVRQNISKTTEIIDIQFASNEFYSLFSTSESLVELDNFRFANLPFGELVRKFIYESQMIDLRHQSIPEPSGILTLVNNFINQAILVYRASQALLSQIAPTDIIVFNGRTPSTCPIIWACQERNARVIIHERGPDYSKYELYSSRPSLPATQHDRIVSFSRYRHSAIAEHSAKIFFSRLAAHKPKSWHSFSSQQDDFSAPLSMQLPASSCVFFLSSNREIDSVPGFHFDGYFGDQFRTILAVAEACTKLGMSFYVRAHPNQAKDSAEIEHLKLICNSCNANFIPSESPVNSLKLGTLATKVVTFASTLTWQLMYLRIRVGLLCESLAQDFTGIENLRSLDCLDRFLVSTRQLCDPRFAILYGDYMECGGYPFTYFRPDDLFNGCFDQNGTLLNISSHFDL